MEQNKALGYRREAERLRREAERVNAETVRLELLDLASLYERLADGVVSGALPMTAISVYSVSG
jgi:hypothetical protein